MNQREYPSRPLLGVSAWVIHGGKVLLIRRAAGAGKGLWSLPGGLVELGETLVRAVQREVFEETGVRIGNPVLVEPVDLIFPDERGAIKAHYVVVNYVAPASGAVELKPNNEVLEARWVSFNELPSYELVPGVARVLPKALKLVRGIRATAL